MTPRKPAKTEVKTRHKQTNKQTFIHLLCHFVTRLPYYSFYILPHFQLNLKPMKDAHRFKIQRTESLVIFSKNLDTG